MVAIIFMVAGMSSRFGGKPKQLEKIGPNDESLIEYSVNQALKNKFNHLWFITNLKTEDKFKSIFGDNYKGIPVSYITQTYNHDKRVRPWGTTDAICQLNNKIFEPFILVNGDDIYGNETFKKGFEMMKNNQNINIIGIIETEKTLPEQGNVNRGIIHINKFNNQILKIEEKININKHNINLEDDIYANVNFIGLQPIILNHLNDILIKFKNDNQNNPKIECLLPNNLSQLIDQGLLILEYFIIEKNILGITNPGDELILKELLKKE